MPTGPQWLGDPSFVRVPVSGSSSKAYADHLRAGIDETRAHTSAAVAP